MAQKKSIGLIDNFQYADGKALRSPYAQANTADYFRYVGGNSGNVAFVHGTRSCIQGNMVRMSWGSDPEWVHRNVSHIVVCCANQIGSHVDLGVWSDTLERLGLPVTLVGLGAQTTNYESHVEVPAGTMRFLDTVKGLEAGTGLNIGVRGAFTQAVLRKRGVASAPIGCPSLFISARPSLGRDIAQSSRPSRQRRLAIAAGNPFHAANCKVESTLLGLCTTTQGAYIAQHPAELMALALGNQDIASDQLGLVAQHLGFARMGDCKRWFDRHAYIFHDADTWMYFLRHFDAVIGARYHGVALGVQASIPGITIHIDNRTRELSETTRIPAVSVERAAALSADKLADLCYWPAVIGHEFDQNRRLMAGRMVEFLEGNGLPPSDRLLTLARHQP